MKHKNLNSSYKEEYVNKVENPVSYATYKNIIQLFFAFLMNKILEGDEITLPCRLGTLSVRGVKEKVIIGEDNKIKGLSVNWAKTKLLWDSNPQSKLEKKLIYNTNEHSSGIRYRFVWGRNRVLTQFKSLYSFRFIRTFKRELSRKIFEENKEYITVN